MSRRPLVHLIDPSAADAGPHLLHWAAREIARDRAGGSTAIVVLGNRTDVSTAQQAGIELHAAETKPVAIPAGLLTLARPLLRARLAQLGAHEVRAWSARSALLSTASGAVMTTFAAVARPPGGWAMARRLRQLHGRGLRMLPLCDAIHDAWREAVPFINCGPQADPFEHISNGAGDHPQKPVEEREARRQALRESWGASDDEYVFTLLGEPPRATDARMAVYLLVLTHVAGRKVRLVLDPRTCGADRLTRWASGLGVRNRLVLRTDAGDPSTLVAFDGACFFPARGRSPRGSGLEASRRPWGNSAGDPSTPVAVSFLPLVAALEAGLHVVAEDDAVSREFAAEYPRLSLVAPGNHSLAANRLIRIMSKGALAEASTVLDHGNAGAASPSSVAAAS